MKKTWVFLAVIVALIILALLVSHSGWRSPAASPFPSATPTGDRLSEYLNQNADLPPHLLETSPASGEQISLNGELALSFDQPMDQPVTAKALAITGPGDKPLSGNISWKDARTLAFKPQGEFSPGATYQVKLAASAASSRGKPLEQPVVINFQAQGALLVSQVFPADKAADVENQAAITVMFNQPVVPLLIAEEQDKLPNPIQIQPEVKGQGEWINTSLYVFRPAGELAGGQTYRVTVKAGLADASGLAAARLQQDYTWSFSVAAPSISSVSVNNGELVAGAPNVPLNPTFRVYFRQPMDNPSVEAALHITSTKGAAPFTVAWDEQGTQAEIKPTRLLNLGTEYTLTLDASARAADGGSLAASLTRPFTTVPYPSVLGTAPSDMAVGAEPNFQISFAAPMDFKSLAGRVVFTPSIDTKTHSWYNPGNSTLSFYGLAPSTRYTVQILAGMRDPYGNPIRTAQTVTFTTQALLPGASLMMPYQPVYRASGAQDFYLQYTNVDTVSASLYSLSLEKFTGLMKSSDQAFNYSGDEKDLVWQFSDRPQNKLDERAVKDLTMTGKDGKPLGVGFYFLGMKASPVDYKTPFLDSRLFYVSTDNLTVKVSPGQILAWVTDLRTGRPTPGVQVKVFDDQFNLAASGAADQDGLFQAAMDTTSTLDPLNKASYQMTWYVMVSDAGRFAFASSQWGSGVSPESFGLFSQYYRPWTATTSYVYTERPLYRPGQPVYFKGILRNDDDLAYSLPDQKAVEVVINNYKGEVFRQTLPLSEIGTFDGVFALAPETDLGSYSLRVSLPGSTFPLGSANFDIADYRRPEFQLDLQASPADVLPGDAFQVGIAASYYSGGGLSNAAFQWTLRSEPYTFTPPPAYSGYSFSDAEYDNWDYYANRQNAPKAGQIAEGSGQTDADGKAAISLKAQPALTNTDQRLVFEATITDFSGSSVSGQAQTVMHKSAVYPGIRSKTYVGNVNQDQVFELAALDWDGRPVPGAKVDVQIVERKWYSVQQEDDNGQLTWKTSVEETPVAQFNAVSLDDKGLGSVTFRPEKGGIYRARVAAVDARGNPSQASTFLWVAGTDFIPWIQTNDRSFQLIADRDTYAPGDTAELLIASPFQGESYALVTIERGHVRKVEVLRLQSNSTLYHLPITTDMAPNIYVSVVIVKGIDETNPRPNFKVGMARLQVSTGEQALRVSLKADQSQAAPRQAVQYTVETTTQDGKPVQAEVSMALSDLAALSLKDSTTPSLMDFFYAPRSLSVITGVGITQSIEDYNAQIVTLLPVEGKSAGSGGGKGSGYSGVIEVRQDFPDTAFWQASVKTGADGKATVRVTLPDNLTTWRMDARAVTADTRVGQAALDLVSTRPLLVRPQTPRFFVVGDRLSLGAAVHNNTAQDLEVAVSLDAAGLVLQSDSLQRITIPAKRQAYVTWQVAVPPESQRVDLVFSAEGGGLEDSTKPTLATLDNGGIPVYRFETPETVGTSGTLSENGARVEAVSLPASMRVQKGQLNVELASSLAAGMTDGLTYLEHYPYECTEQTVSRFLPNVRLAQALRAAGIQDDALEANLKTQVNLALQKLDSRQNPDGGWGWWDGMQSDVLTSAYAALGLAEARAAGFDVNAQTLNRALDFLRSNLKSFSDLPAAQDLNRQGFVLYVLARAGSPDVSRTVQLYDHRQSMAIYARGFLLQTLHKIDPQDARLKTLLSDLNNAAILSASGAHWEEKNADYWNWNTDLRSTAIVLSALIETDPKDALNVNAVRWLMANRKAGRWNGTQETAWSLLALTDWISATDDLKPDYRYAAAFNGIELAQGSANPQSIRDVRQLSVDVTQMLSGQANRLVIARDGNSGSLYYTAYLNVWLPVDQVQALDRGVVITRQYFRPEDLTHPVTQAKQGEVLMARLTVIAPDTLRYLLVDDPLPAGMEAVDPNLKTNPQAQQPDTYDWKRVETEGWGWWFFTHAEMRDEKVVLSTDVLPPGTYIYTYLVRASTPGSFNVMPPTAQEFYFPDVYGRGSGSQFVIEP